MNDDLGRGLLNWPAERWDSLDTLAADTTTASAVMRNLVGHREQLNATTVRIARNDIPIILLPRILNFNMQDDSEEDLQRIVQDRCPTIGRRRGPHSRRCDRRGPSERGCQLLVYAKESAGD